MKNKKKLIKKVSHRDWHKTLLHSNSTIQDAIRVLNETCLKIVLVVDAKTRLVGTVSDGDIRRAMMRGQGLAAPLVKILNRNPLVAHQGHRREAVIQLMLANEVQQIPIVDTQRRVVGLHLWDELYKNPVRTNLFIIMAGGEGRRLRPFTEHRPKPMVEVAGKPILEHIVLKAKKEGFNRFVVAVHHLGRMIEDYFGNGKRLGVKISYLRERKPLGTAGAIRLLKQRPKEPYVVTNGDVLADFQYGELLDFHNRHDAEATMAVRAHEWQNPYGVVKTKGLEITGFQEKPLVRAIVNAGVYVLSPRAYQSIPREIRCDMPELFCRLLKNKMPTIAYPLHESWVDVGKPEDLLRANNIKMVRPKI